MRVALKLMDAKVHNKTLPDYPKFVTYSAHDWTVATMLEFFNATNGNFTVVPFAHSIHIELHSTRGCPAHQCYWVEIYSNMERLSFEDVCYNPIRCTYDEFLTLLDSRGFIHTTSAYANECAESYTPPTTASNASKERAQFYNEKFRNP